MTGGLAVVHVRLDWRALAFLERLWDGLLWEVVLVVVGVPRGRAP